MELTKLRYRDLILVLVMENKILLEIFKGEKKYEPLLNELIKYDSDGYEPLPTQKDLLALLNMSRRQLMDLMQELYQDFNNKLGNPHVYKISETQIYLHVVTMDNDVWYIGADGLQFIPQKGDSVVISFIRDHLGWCHFKVKEVWHEIENGVHIITIYLNDKLEDDE